jgi:uncharacterized protein (TIGR00661 family)
VLNKEKILIAPLDWGLGHATRCIPIIYVLLQKGCEVIIAASGESGELLKKEFPQLKYIPLKGYDIKYSNHLPSWLAVGKQIPKIILKIWQEHRWLKKIIDQEKISVVISDNRFGLWNNNIRSVYITHQVMIKCPKGLKIFEPILYFIHRFFISRYSQCWVPDFASKEKNLSGDLSHKYHLPANAIYIGSLSRFIYSPAAEYKYDVAAIVSGIEPQRTIFESQLKKQLAKLSLKSIIVSGKPSEEKEEKSENVSSVSHLTSNHLETTLAASKLIICRSGYSGIMDLVRMKKNAVLIPTPGQTEQEYLAEELMKKGIFFSAKQSGFNLADSIEESKRFSIENFEKKEEHGLLIEAVEKLMDCQ